MEDPMSDIHSLYMTVLGKHSDPACYRVLRYGLFLCSIGPHPWMFHAQKEGRARR